MTEHCFICHKKIEAGSTASSIHTGCMALMTKNAEVYGHIEKATEQGIGIGRRNAIDEAIAAARKKILGKPNLSQGHPEYERACEDNEIYDAAIKEILSLLLSLKDK